jgi:hypothetical protein
MDLAQLRTISRTWRLRLESAWARIATRGPAPAPAPRQPPPRQSEPRSAAPGDIFTPTRPRSGRRTLVGRQVEVARILDAVCEDGAHVVLYAERGRGKTSLSNLAIEGMRRRGIIVARYACEASSQFDTILHGLAADLPASLLADIPTDARGCDSLLPDRPLRPADVAALPQGLTCPKLAFVIDEFDRVTDEATRTRLADTIKLVSDRGIPLSFIIVGVSATLEAIIGQHASIQRNIAAIHLPLLPDQELASMIERGGAQSGIFFPPEAVALIVGVARGMPYMAQLLGLRIAQTALARGHASVQNEDLASAVQRLLDETSGSITGLYNTLTDDGRDSDMTTALLRLAEAEQDRWGRLRAVTDAGSVTIGGRRVSAALWERVRAAAILEPAGEAGLLQFSDRAMIYYVQLLAARARVLGERRLSVVREA